MDKKSKLIIVVLIVIGVVFALGLGTNLIDKEGEPRTNENMTQKQKEEEDQRAVDDYDRNGWLGSMDQLMGRFSPRLDASRFRRSNEGAECKREGNILSFNSNTGCAIEILGRHPQQDDCDDKYESTTLKLAEGTAATRAAAARIKMKPVLVQTQPFNRVKPELAVVKPTLTVAYKPTGESGYEPVKKRRDEFRLVVLKQGGTLKLNCSGCGNNQPVEVNLAIRESCD
jgi:hypothetical protein